MRSMENSSLCISLVFTHFAGQSLPQPSWFRWSSLHGVAFGNQARHDQSVSTQRILSCVCNLTCNIIQTDCMFVGNFVVINIKEGTCEMIVLIGSCMAIHRCCFVFTGVLICLFLFVLPTDLPKRDMSVVGSMKSGLSWLYGLGGVALRRRQGERERGSAAGGPCCFC